jgi:MFS family permease
VNKKIKTDEEKELDARKDIFWRTFFLMFFVGAIAYGFLSKYHLDTPVFTIALVILCFAGVLFLPGYFYNLKWVQEQYDIFQNKKWQTATDKNERAKAKVYYNLVLFFVLSFFGWLAAGIVAEFVFNKNDNVKAILDVVFILFALVFSLWITEKKSKQPQEDKE